MKAKPAHLGPEYGAQFSDQAVVDAYHTRPPYPTQIIEILTQLAQDEPRDVLELGCGTGDVTRYLAPHVNRIDAVDPSVAMLNKARSLPNSLALTIRWINQTAEAFDYPQSYALIYAAESLHWMDWGAIFPRIRRALSPNARLALVLGRELSPQPWRDALTPLFAKYSTNREFQRYDLIDELTQRHLFIPEQRVKTEPQPWSQPLADFLECFHSRNGFSRSRMREESAREFDEQVAALITPYAQNGWLHFQLRGEIAWGLPASG
jgi:SAM-dependent methyltransferase